jgi:nucleoside phosphorylase
MAKQEGEKDMEPSKKTKVWICASTELEAQSIPLSWKKWGMESLIVGVGIPEVLSTLYNKYLLLDEREKPTFIINVGIAGVYPKSYNEKKMGIGDLVLGTSDCYGDVGMELPDSVGNASSRFTPITTTDFGGFYKKIFSFEPYPDWMQTSSDHDFNIHLGKGCTVNQCTGRDSTGIYREKVFTVDFESMEGAALAQFANQYQIPIWQIRAFSNVAANRNMDPRNIQKSLNNLEEYLDAQTVSLLEWIDSKEKEI